MNTVTQWFPSFMRPMHIGAYEVSWEWPAEASERFSWWDGQNWSWVSLTPNGARNANVSHTALLHWRGLTDVAA